jgi:hypothetical protein
MHNNNVCRSLNQPPSGSAAKQCRRGSPASTTGSQHSARRHANRLRGTYSRVKTWTALVAGCDLNEGWQFPYRELRLCASMLNLSPHRPHQCQTRALSGRHRTHHIRDRPTTSRTQSTHRDRGDRRRTAKAVVVVVVVLAAAAAAAAVGWTCHRPRGRRWLRSRQSDVD